MLAPPSALNRRPTEGKSIPTEFRSNKPMPPMSRDLTDAQWAILEAIIPEPLRRTDGRGRPGKTVEGSTHCPKRDPLGTADGRSVGRRSRPLFVVPNLPSPLPALGPFRSNERNCGSSSPRTEGPRCSGCTGSIHRRQLRSGEKRGSMVGKTKRGKGTKIMAVADRNGLPVSICVESARPHEVKLAVPTLVQMVISEAPRNLIGDNARL